MGDAVNSESYTPRQRTRYRQRLIDDLEVFDRHLQQAEFIDQGTIGLELELNLVDKNMQPKTCNGDVLAALDDEYQSEIGAYNVEMNHPPLSISGTGLQELEDGLNQRLNTVRMAANKADAEVAMIGTLPSVTTEFLEDPAWMTSENRYKALSNSVLESRGELVHIELEGQEKYRHGFEDIAPESTCTSIQLHLQVSPNHFAAAWNASQAIAGVQTALSANSPLFAGHKLWHESRVPVFQQSIDTRTPELVTQGVRPRVWFGERWITSAFDLFEENVRYFSPLLPEDRVESGTPIVTDGKPGLHYLNMQNGTIWRWNRPIYDPNTELSHIRVENRLLPAGPTVADIVADAAFYYGLVNFLVGQTRPVWSRLSFDDAANNFFAGARGGIHANMTWPTLGTIPVAELVTEHLLEQAEQGLEQLAVNPALIQKHLGIIEGRARNRQNGATWQLAALDNATAALSAEAGHDANDRDASAAVSTADATVNATTDAPAKDHDGPDSTLRRQAIARMLSAYIDNQKSGEPVHTWSTDIS
ncbi:glutamate-cysteine ligase family protein [Corynebacterium pseudodiphtheriticum]|uniref:glutamate-cysteine ligase family protein n=1 Tax=Corynebacterium pseudodiphtheriticum TaxID=37637 RepID=UPI00254B3F9E|nr:glutamate-cysteine ligase family protein [Corynebacterium pseudodiphtheriticum]MDK8577184.1 glutamate-cysteine ligase family protein [Corynebacterium pseudodiphtheriticum]MDK8701262.1 glutamate-cysteine ligase family protein [Corynebacterium pseudodiphtheriticum]MDK8773828.1 glutamate-cysteine ligase family protein [Corynebacterium pseudodiphtheriticum]